MTEAKLHTYLSRANDSDFDNDSSGVLLYWDCVEDVHPLLMPSQAITDPNVVIAKLGQQNILPNHLLFKPADACTMAVTDADGHIVGSPVPPGLSGFLFFNVFDSRGKIQDYCSTQLAKDLHRKSRLHVAQVRDIVNAGWIVYYAPLINRSQHKNNPLHVIISPNSVHEITSVSAPTLEERDALAKAFIRW